MNSSVENHTAERAPVALFTFNRPDHTRRTIEALQRNLLAGETDLYIFSDGPRNHADLNSIQAVRRLAQQVSGFRSVQLVPRETNWGLAKSIIEGVTSIIERHGKIIVLEDDVVTSESFLQYMNDALTFYEHNPRVWHISGWNYPIDPAGLGDAFFLRVMNCWGWGTWRDRWRHYDRDPEKLMKEFDPAMINRFDLNGSGVFWIQVVQNCQKKINTWAIFWYAAIFRNGGLCLNPAVAYVNNIGHDGSGTNHSLAGKRYSSLREPLAQWEFPNEAVEHDIAIHRIQAYYESIRPRWHERMKLRWRSAVRKLGLLMTPR